MRTITLLTLLVTTSPATAQQGATQSREAPSISVSGEGKIKTKPDVADISYSILTEGATPDAATSSLAGKSKAIDEALSSLSPEGASFETSAVSIKAAKSPECKQTDDDDDTPRLSSGPCAIKGYVASMTVRVRLAPPVAGTAVGLAARLGATGAEIERFSLRDPRPARDQALAAAVADARVKAAAIASASGAKLGPLLSASDGDSNYDKSNDIVVTAGRSRGLVSPAPIEVAIEPPPVETGARVSARFAVIP